MEYKIIRSVMRCKYICYWNGGFILLLTRSCWLQRKLKWPSKNDEDSWDDIKTFMNTSGEKAFSEILTVIVHRTMCSTLFPVGIWSPRASMTHESKSLPTGNSPTLSYKLEKVDVSYWPNLIQVASTESLKFGNVWQMWLA